MNTYRSHTFRHTLSAFLVLALSLFATTFALTFSSTAKAQGQLTATVDRNQISLEETLKLSVKYSEQVMFDEPDFSDLKRNFDVLGSHRSNQYRSINGKVESWTKWTLTLAPKRKGKLLIPSLKFEDSFSDAIEITVAESAPTASSGDKPVYLEAELDKQQGYVQEQFLYTIRLFTSVDLNGLDRGELKIKNALVKPVAENQYQRTINGIPYGVVETTYAVFPQQSGSLEIPSTLWTVAIQNTRGYSYDPFLRQGGQQLRLRTKPASVQIDSKPARYPSDQWLPAKNLSISQSWSQPPEDFKIGEPITRSITIQAKGLMASQLPPLELSDIGDVKYYPDQPQSDEAIARDGVTTTKTESYAIVPSRAGNITLPAITVHWWDTQAKQIREATLPEQTIVVAAPTSDKSNSNLPATIPDSTQTPDTDTQASAGESLGDGSLSGMLDQARSTRGIWFYIAILLIVTNLITLIQWLRARRKKTAPASPTQKTRSDQPSEKQAYKSLKSTLQRQPQQQDIQAIRSALIIWARIYQNDSELASLQQISETLPPLAEYIGQIEAGIYGQKTATLDTEGFQQALIDLRRNGHTPSSVESKSNLPPLYS
ncbi:BatD family protein [Pseudomaricurvus sp.]|uniref:BatD family protein n=1 Tax=Pseudomaricurvus sp. TaxID=2004510 RepID=UPI003F6C75BF